MSVSGPILVFLANGVRGGAVVRAAQKRGFPVRMLVRQTGTGLDLRDVETVRGDLNDPASLVTACAGVAHAVLQIPIDAEPVMVRQAEAAVAAARRGGVRTLILKLASASRPFPCDEPSFAANAAVERVVRASGIPSAIVRPSLYLDNLLKPSAQADLIERGVFAPPIATRQRIAWTCADDCAEAAMLLLERGAYGGDHRIAGAHSVTGDEFARHLSTAWGRSIAYQAQDIAEFEREVDAAIGPGVGRRVASKFRYFARHPDQADRILADPFEPSPPLADFVPTSIEDWARRHVPAFPA